QFTSNQPSPAMIISSLGGSACLTSSLLASGTFGVSILGSSILGSSFGGSACFGSSFLLSSFLGIEASTSWSGPCFLESATAGNSLGKLLESLTSLSGMSANGFL